MHFTRQADIDYNLTDANNFSVGLLVLSTARGNSQPMPDSSSTTVILGWNL